LLRRPREHPTLWKLALVLVGAAAAIGATGASAADFEVDNGPCKETPGDALLLSCPTAYVGVDYRLEIESEEGSGCSPNYDWFEIRNSVLPAGLSMTRDGVISGVPASAGPTRFWVWNHDLSAAQGGPAWCIRDDTSEREFSISVDPGLAIDDETLAGATVGQGYSETLTAKEVVSLNPPTGSAVQATWSLASGALPPGLGLSAQGLLTGTPTSEGSYQFVVKAQNGSPFDTKEYTLSVRQPVVVKSPFASAPAPRAEVGVRFGRTVTASGGSGTYTWSLTSGTLPPGIALGTSNGVVSGVPRAAGNFAFAVAATDTEGRVTTANVALAVAPRVAIKTRRLQAAKVGRPYRSRVAAVGGVRPLKWRLSSGKLPVGVRFVKSTGTLAGTPRRAGTFHVVVEARDALGAKARQRLSLNVRP
jgi:hypothetical protein